eukprot:358826-Chlamydomonas_euryale.AAC.5
MAHVRRGLPMLRRHPSAQAMPHLLPDAPVDRPPGRSRWLGIGLVMSWLKLVGGPAICMAFGLSLPLPAMTIAGMVLVIMFGPVERQPPVIVVTSIGVSTPASGSCTVRSGCAPSDVYTHS